MNMLDLMLSKYRDTVALDSAKARRYIQRLDYKEDFYLLQCIAQTYLDECRFVGNSNKIRKKIDFRKWRMAEKYIIKAFTIDSNNAEVLYTMGKVRKANFQNDIAIYCFEKLIRLGVVKIAKQDYSRGIDFARELVNDTRFELYRLYYLDNPRLSKKYLVMYKKGLEKGITTIFNPLNKFLMK